MRSINSLQAKPLSPWKLMLRDGLNLYAVRYFPITWGFLKLIHFPWLGHLAREPCEHVLLVHHEAH